MDVERELRKLKARIDQIATKLEDVVERVPESDWHDDISARFEDMHEVREAVETTVVELRLAAGHPAERRL